MLLITTLHLFRADGAGAVRELGSHGGGFRAGSADEPGWPRILGAAAEDVGGVCAVPALPWLLALGVRLVLHGSGAGACAFALSRERDGHVLLREDTPYRLDGPPVPGAFGSAALRIALPAVEIAEEGLYWLTAGAAAVHHAGPGRAALTSGWLSVSDALHPGASSPLREPGGLQT